MTPEVVVVLACYVAGVIVVRWRIDRDAWLRSQMHPLARWIAAALWWLWTLSAVTEGAMRWLVRFDGWLQHSTQGDDDVRYVQFSMPQDDAERLRELVEIGAGCQGQGTLWQPRDRRVVDRVKLALQGKDRRARNRFPLGPRGASRAPTPVGDPAARPAPGRACSGSPHPGDETGAEGRPADRPRAS